MNHPTIIAVIHNFISIQQLTIALWLLLSALHQPTSSSQLLLIFLQTFP